MAQRERARRSQGVRPTDDELLDGVLKSVAAHGFRAITMEQLAESADTTMQTLYAHFGSKSALLERLLDREFARYENHLKAAALSVPFDGDFEPAVRARVDAVFEFVKEYPAASRILRDPNAPGMRSRRRHLHDAALAFGLKEFGEIVGAAVDHEHQSIRVLLELMGNAVDVAMNAALDAETDVDRAATMIATFVTAGMQAVVPSLRTPSDCSTRRSAPAVSPPGTPLSYAGAGDIQAGVRPVGQAQPSQGRPYRGRQRAIGARVAAGRDHLAQVCGGMPVKVAAIIGVSASRADLGGKSRSRHCRALCG